MATLVKNFRIKSGLVVEGTTGTINGQNILTETGGDSYILNLVGGATLVKSVDTSVFNVDGAGNLTINNNTFDSYGSASSAQTAAESYADGLASNYDAAGSADAAETAANSYTDGRETAITSAYQSYADTAESDAISAAATYTDGRETAITTAYQEYADQAEADAISTAAADATTKANAAQAAAEQHADDAIAALVDSAPETLDTLNELAAALQDNPDIISDLQDIAAGKQDTLTAGDNIDITGSTISVTGLDTGDVTESPAGPLYFTDSRAISAIISLNNPDYYALNEKDGKAGVYKQDVASTLASSTGSGITQSDIDSKALQIDRSVVDGWYDSNGAAAQALTDAQAYADTAESDAVSSAATYTDGQITNLTDGTNSFQTVNIEDVVAQRATSSSALGATANTVFSWTATDYRSAKILVKVANGVHTQISELMVTLDTSNNVAVSEYGITYSNGSELAAITAEYGQLNGAVNIIATPANANTDVTVFATLVI